MNEIWTCNASDHHEHCRKEERDWCNDLYEELCASYAARSESASDAYDQIIAADESREARLLYVKTMKH